MRAQLAGIRGWVAFLDDELTVAVEDLRAAIDAELRFGAHSVASVQLAILARAHFAAGAWGEAVVAAERAVTLSTELRQPAAQPFAWWAAALVPAARGEFDEAEGYARLAAGVPGSAARPVGRRRDHARAGARRQGRAGARARRPRECGGASAARAAHAPGFWPWQDLYAGALVAPLGRLDEADGFLTAHEQRAAERSHRSMRGRLARGCGAHWRPRAASVTARRRASTARRRSTSPTCPTRRRSRGSRTGSSCAAWAAGGAPEKELLAARETLAALGARPALERCERELAAAGLRVPHALRVPATDPAGTGRRGVVARGSPTPRSRRSP